MGLKKAENQVKILLAETILAMCRNTLNNHAEVNVEGLLGITLDNDEIFLVSINQTISNPDVPSKSSKKQSVEENVGGSDANESTSRRKRAKSKTNDDSSSESDEETNKEGKTKKRRRKRKKRQGSKSSNEESGSSSESEENDIKPSIPHERNPGSQNNRNGQNSRSDSNENANSFSVMQDDTSLSNMSETVHVKKEMDDDDEEEDIVIIKEELADLPMSSDNQFMNLQQQYESGPFQPQDFNSSFPGTPQQSMSSNLSQPQPGPSSSNAGRRSGLGSHFGVPVPIDCDEFFDLTPPEIVGLSTSTTTLVSGGKSSKHSACSTSKIGFTCALCGQFCGTKQSMDRHMLVHTGDKPYACSVCGKRFGRDSSLYRHFKNLHRQFANTLDLP